MNTARRVSVVLRPRFRHIDQVAEYNQAKVIAAMQKNRVNATHFAATTGYGYDDDRPGQLERVYADCFRTEAALVRPQITCGTHALAVALGANLLPGTSFSALWAALRHPGGGHRHPPSPCSLKEYGVTYAQVDLLPDGGFDYDGIRAPSTRKPSSSPSSAPRATPPGPPFLGQQIGEADRLLQAVQARRALHGGQLLRRVCGDQEPSTWGPT